MPKPKSIFYFDTEKMPEDMGKNLWAVIRPHVQTGNCVMVKTEDIAKHFGIKGKTEAKDDYTPDFEELWALWNKGGKRTAAKAYHSAMMKRGYTHAQILAGIPTLHKEEKKREGSDGANYKPLHLSTWLNGDRFLNVSVDEGVGQLTPFEKTVQEIGWALQYVPTGNALVALRECVSDGLTVEMVQANKDKLKGPDDFVAFCYSIMN